MFGVIGAKKHQPHVKADKDLTKEQAIDLAKVLSYSLATKTEIEYAVSKGLQLSAKLNRGGQQYYFIKKE